MNIRIDKKYFESINKHSRQYITSTKKELKSEYSFIR